MATMTTVSMTYNELFDWYNNLLIYFKDESDKLMDAEISVGIVTNEKEMYKHVREYNEKIDEIAMEYRDIAEERVRVIQEEELAIAEGREPEPVDIVMLPDKDKEEYFAKVNAVREQIIDVNIAKVFAGGTDISVADASRLYFMFYID